MKYGVLILGLFIVFVGRVAYSDQIKYFETRIEQTEEAGIFSQDEASRLRDLKEYLSEIRQNSFIITSVGSIITFGGITMFFKKNKKKL